jgi:hypothetical protein
MKHLLLIVLLLPFFAAAQSPGRADDSLRKASDTMHFPNPFQFMAKGTANINGTALLEKCYQWISAIEDSLKEIKITKDAAHKKIVAVNVPATADISCSIIITITGKNYTCYLQQYIYHTINGARIPVEKAATIPDYKITTKVERVIIMRKYHLVFNSLDAYIKKRK